MKIIITILTCVCFLYSCTDSGKPAERPAQKDTTAAQRFFPVTEYLKGEIFNIKNAGVNPLKYTTVNEHTDSVWIKIELLDSLIQEFLQPEIDSANLISLFTEKSFMDQTLNAITFTYDPVATLPDSMKLKRWDVYIDPKTNKVKRIYMIMQIDKVKTMQLTWVNGQWCKTTTIVTDEKGLMKVEKEEKIIWDF